MKEDRAIKRFNIELPMLIKGVDIRGRSFEEVTNSLNISSGGAYFFLQSPVKKENRLQVVISLPGKIRNRIDAKGTVLRVKNLSNEEGRKKAIALQFLWKSALKKGA